MNIEDLLKEKFKELYLLREEISSLPPAIAVKRILEYGKVEEFDGEEELLRKQAQNIKPTEVLQWFDEMLSLQNI
ncbi:MAG: hypothetical protein AB1422_17305 [bacterium]